MPHLPFALGFATVFALACGGDNKPGPQPADSSALCGTSAAELVNCVEQDRLSADLNTIAMPRVPLSEHWQTVQDLCRSRLEGFGYQVELHSYGTGINVIGRRPGTDVGSAAVVVSAHYDHISGCSGADDNASGVAATLEIARLLATRENRHPLVVACWDEEERGLIGSAAYADREKAAGATFSAMFSLEGIGFFTNEPDSQTLAAGFDMIFPTQTAEIVARGSRGDFIALIADQASVATATRFVVHAESVGLLTSVLDVSEALKLAPATADLRRSDQASFWVHDYPGIMVSDTANFRNPNYHCMNSTMDVASTLDLGFMTKNTQATLGAAVDALDAP